MQLGSELGDQMTSKLNDQTISRRAARMRASEIRELLKLLDRPGMVSFAGGIPDPDLFDIEAYRSAYSEALSDGDRSLQYSTTEGYQPLRRWIADYMCRKGVTCDESHILITHGSQQALDLIGKLMIDPGSTVVTLAPTYLGALQSFSAYEPEYRAVRFQNGVAETNVTAARVLYLVPDFANPTGETLSVEDRKAALALARRAGAIVVEDAAYTELRFEGENVPPIAALDIQETGSIDDSCTLFCGTFSKTLAPGLRIGWICGPTALLQKLTLIKQASDLHTATINQQVTFRVAADNFEIAVEKAKVVYHKRRDAMLSALGAYAPEGLSWTSPAGGLFVWITLPEQIDSAKLLEKAVARNFAFVPGAAFYPDGSGRNHLRMSYSLLPEDVIDQGIKAFCDLVREEIA